MTDKKSFLESINQNTIFNAELYKKIYAYSIYDNSFLQQVEAKLINIGRKNIILDYNEWLKKWKHEYIYGYLDCNGKKHEGIIAVSEWYAGECEKQYQELIKIRRKQVRKKDWKEKQKADLLQMKRELLQKKLLKSIGS